MAQSLQKKFYDVKTQLDAVVTRLTTNNYSSIKYDKKCNIATNLDLSMCVVSSLITDASFNDCSYDESTLNNDISSCFLNCSNNGDCIGVITEYLDNGTENTYTIYDSSSVQLTSDVSSSNIYLKESIKTDTIQLNYLLNQLNEIYKQMKTEATNTYNNGVSLFDLSDQQLIYYKQLLDGSTLEIEELIPQIENSNEAVETTSNIVLQSDLKYRFWFLFTIILLFVAYGSLFVKDAPVNPVILMWVIMTLILIILSYNLGNSTGFMLWGFFIALYVLMASGIFRVM